MTTPSSIIRHIPEGYHPGGGLNCDRIPHRPATGQTVLVKAEINRELAVEEVVLKLSCGGKQSDVPGRIVTNHHEARTARPPLSGSAVEPVEYYLFDLGRFAAGDEIVYEIIAGAGDRSVTAGPYRFIVNGLYPPVERAGIYPTSGGAVVAFANHSNYLSRLELGFRDRRLHMSLSLADTGVLSGAPVEKLTWSDPETGTMIELHAMPFRFMVKDINGHLLFSSPTGSPCWLWRGIPNGKAYTIQIKLASEAEHYYGFGERFDAVDQNGFEPDVCVINQYDRQGDWTYYPVPFFLTERGYGLFVRSDRYVRFGLKPRLPGTITVAGEVNPLDPRMELVFFFGTPKEIVRSFTFYTGQPALPPKWAFGPWMSGNSWNTQREVEEHLATTEQIDIPATVLVIEAWSDEATFYIFNDARYETKSGDQDFGLSDFAFAADAKWPDPKGMVNKLHECGMRLILWQIPVLKQFAVPENPQHQADKEYAIAEGYCARNADGTPYSIPDGWFTGSLILDFTNPAAREWWFAKRRYLLDELRVDGFKTDGGEFILDDSIRFHDGSDGAVMRNRYPIAYIQAYHEFMGDKRLTFSRAGFTGGQQYPMYWAGDQISTYEEFRAVLRAGLSLGLSGSAFWGFDLGGFSGDVPTADLYLRAAQTAAFCPVMQYHSESRGVENYDRTPWNMAARTGDERIVPIYRFYAWLRMNLLPYIWRQARMAVANGEPLMRALCLDFPDDVVACQLEDEYMFGHDLLVAPILSENVRERRLYLPGDGWLDFWTLQPVSGGWQERYPSDLEVIPIFLRRGAVLPLNLGDSFRLGRSSGAKGAAYGRLCFLIAVESKATWEYDDGEGSRVRLVPEEKGLTVQILTDQPREIFLLTPEEHPEWEAAGESEWGGHCPVLHVYRFGRSR